jgi:NAD(P)-dependent dehydrogenase (short-subunit alcohol dehydrogenase family)
MPSILITGVSSGLGRAALDRFAQEGWQVIGTTRRAGEPDPATLPPNVRLMTLDLADPASMSALAADVLAEQGAPDVLVNNAGTLLFASLEDTPAEEIRQVFDVNVFSQLELVKAFLPAMRERGSGTIVNVTSLGGEMVFPFFASYNASKHAMEGFSEGLWHELQPFGIRVKIVQPGYIATPIYDKAGVDEDDPTRSSPPYRAMRAAMVRAEQAVSKRTSPEDAADELYKAVIDDSDRLRYPIAAYAATLITARRVMGDRLFTRWAHKRWFARMDE